MTTRLAMTTRPTMREEDGDWVLYMLRCGDGSLYTGITRDLTRRLAAHEAGRGAKYTRGRAPLTVAYQARVGDRVTAARLETAIKRLPSAAKRAIAREQPPVGELLGEI